MHNVCIDTTTAVAIASETTWNPIRVQSILSDQELSKRSSQFEHESSHPSQLSQLLAPLLYSNQYRLHMSSIAIKELKNIIETIAGPLERARIGSFLSRIICYDSLNRITENGDELEQHETHIRKKPENDFNEFKPEERSIKRQCTTPTDNGQCGSCTSPQSTDENIKEKEVGEKEDVLFRISHKTLEDGGSYREVKRRKREERRLKRLLNEKERRIQICADLSKFLKVTKKVTPRHLQIFGDGIRHAHLIYTSDLKFLRACQTQGVDFLKLGFCVVHSPRSLAGL